MTATCYGDTLNNTHNIKIQIYVKKGMNKKKLLEKVIAGPRNIHFRDMITAVEAFGFRLSRRNGNHHIFIHPTISEIVNLQEQENGKAKPYQVRQFLQLIEEYDLKIGA